MVKIEKKCPMCSQVVALNICEQDYQKLMQPQRILIQELFPYLDAFKREFIKSGYCPLCQELLFGNDFNDDRDWELK